MRTAPSIILNLKWELSPEETFYIGSCGLAFKSLIYNPQIRFSKVINSIQFVLAKQQQYFVNRKRFDWKIPERFRRTLQNSSKNLSFLESATPKCSIGVRQVGLLWQKKILGRKQFFINFLSFPAFYVNFSENCSNLWTLLEKICFELLSCLARHLWAAYKKDSLARISW